MSNKYPAIPDPSGTNENLRQSVAALKESVEILTRQRRPVEAGAVSWRDLVDLGLISPEQLPRR